jgi:ATP-binding cassette, subfamily F, member 3
MAVEKEIPIGGSPILRFEDVTFFYQENKFILKESNFVVRKGTKLTLMGQNGAGKSTLFGMITGENEIKEGRIIIEPDVKIAIAKQTISHTLWDMTVREFLLINLEKPDKNGKVNKVYDIDRKAIDSFNTVKLPIAFLDKKIKELSGGQKGRLLIAEALVQKPDILLLDEPTNNLDKDGIKLLTEFMKSYNGTAIVISHDESFLNAFTHGILYVNVQNNKVEQYVGNYFKALEEIKRRVEKEERDNAQREKEMKEKYEKVNYFALKGGEMRKRASKLREEIEELKEDVIDVRKDDKTIKNFDIPCQEEIGGIIMHLTEVEILREGEIVKKEVNIELRKGDRLQIIGPNGIGKTTLLEKIAHRKIDAKIKSEIEIGYYRQDFSTLDFEKSAYTELAGIFKRLDDQKVRATASKFLLTGKELSTPIGNLSEGQKGLLMFAYLTLQQPGILILDEPTNHINFRHIPAINEAIKKFEGVTIIVSHSNDFVRKLAVNHVLDLSK